MSDTRDRFRFQMVSHPRYVSVFRDLIYRLALMHGFTSSGAFDLKLVTGEALTNIIKHAYAEKTDQPIFVEVLLYTSYIEIRFRDYGIQSTIPGGQDLSDYRERGLGIYLISKLTDFHFFDQSSDKGTKLIIKKRIV